MSAIVIENDRLRVAVNPAVGGTIEQVWQKPSGLAVLGQVPWPVTDAPLAAGGARDEPEWLTRYTGGWPLLFPNAGDACLVDGVFHGFHGEASIRPWAHEVLGGGLRLFRRFETIDARMERDIVLDGDTLRVTERLDYHGSAPAAAMWGHHPTFGSDLLASPFEITAGAPTVTVEAAYDSAANPLAPGATGAWPVVDGKHGRFDLSRPSAPCASLAYLTGFARPWAAIRRLDNAVAAVLQWDAERFPCAWLWFELEGTAEQPWDGRTRLIGIEPNTTPNAFGIATARQRGAPLLRLTPGARLTARLALTVLAPRGPITQPPGATATDQTFTTASPP